MTKRTNQMKDKILLFTWSEGNQFFGPTRKSMNHKMEMILRVSKKHTQWPWRTKGQLNGITHPSKDRTIPTWDLHVYCVFMYNKIQCKLLAKKADHDDDSCTVNYKCTDHTNGKTQGHKVMALHTRDVISSWCLEMSPTTSAMNATSNFWWDMICAYCQALVPGLLQLYNSRMTERRTHKGRRVDNRSRP